MSKSPSSRHLFDNPRNVRLLVRSLVVSCVLLFGLDFVLHRHISHPWEEFPGFYAIYGFVACVILVMLARELRKLVMRDEDYYEKNTDVNSDGGKSHD
jgi:hypothetical protein